MLSVVRIQEGFYGLGNRLLKGNLTVIFLVLLTKRAVAVMTLLPRRVFHATGSINWL